MQDDDQSEKLDKQMKQLLVKIEKEPVSAELRALASELQKALNERRVGIKKNS
ncbi:MAG: hypothetical protein ACNA7O_00460 [Rhodobacterales bacterium]